LNNQYENKDKYDLKSNAYYKSIIEFNSIIYLFPAVLAIKNVGEKDRCP